MPPSPDPIRKVRDATQSERWRRVLRFVAPFVVLYLGLCLVARLMYPSALYPAPHGAAPRLPSTWSEVSLGTNESPIVAVRRRGARGAPTVVWFHGNAEVCEDQVSRGDHFAAQGIGFVAMEYRGYGKVGRLTPSEAGIYADAETLVKHLEAEVRDADGGGSLVLVGYSLGSAIAAEMAARGHGARVALVAPFTSMPNMGRKFAPFLPISILMTERYDTLSKAPAIHQAAIVFHGEHDELVPFGMGKAVAAALPNARFSPVAAAGHAGIFTSSPSALAELDAFVAAAR